MVWLGFSAAREDGLQTASADMLDLDFGGIVGGAYVGETRLSCSRVVAQYAKGTTIRNTRQLSVVSEEELQLIAAAMQIPNLHPSWMGANLVVGGIGDFSHVPPSARLQAPSGATVVVDMQNRPCHLPIPLIEAAHIGMGARFPQAARGRRGVTAWVECPGMLRVGDTLRLHVPDQPVWRGSDGLI